MTVFKKKAHPRIIYADPGFQIHSNGIFSETTATMVLKLHMQHNQTLGIKNDKIQGGRESRMAASAKIAKLIKSTFSSEWLIFYMKQ